MPLIPWIGPRPDRALPTASFSRARGWAAARSERRIERRLWIGDEAPTRSIQGFWDGLSGAAWALQTVDLSEGDPIGRVCRVALLV
jgi:hypothetical protein